MPKVNESFVFHSSYRFLFFFLVESSYGFYYLWDKAVYISKGMIKKNNQFLQLSMSLCLIIYSFDLDK